MQLPQKVQEQVEEIARQGGTPLVVAENAKALGVIHLKDIVKGGLKSGWRGCARWASGPS